uniref:Secreted protein n=1 Tax=Meloidogyne javanica TaxID=6303 RepID=A0A915MRJ0_MELJA
MRVFGIVLILLFAMILKELDCVRKKKTKMLDDCYIQDGCASNSVPPRVNSYTLRLRQAHQYVEHAHLNVGGEAQAPQQPNEGVSSSRVNTGSQQPTPKEANTHTPTKRSERIAARHERVQHVHHCGGCQTSK